MYSFICCMIKGIEKSLVFEVSESHSRGYWKQFLLSHPYEHSQYLPAVQGDSVPPPHMYHVHFHFYVMIKGMEEPGYLKILKALQEDNGTNSHVSSL